MELLPQDLGMLTQKVLHDTDLTPAELPDIDLYIDQIITLFESKVGGSKRRPTDKLLTKTMINNYSKEGLIKAIKGKKYSKEHILQILLIYNLKQTLSIQDVKTVLSAVSADDGILELYERFLAVKDDLRQSIPELVGKISDGDHFAGMNESDKKLLLILTLSSTGNYLKRISEDMIDNCL